MYKHTDTYRPFVPCAFLDVLSVDLLSVDLLSIVRDSKQLDANEKVIELQQIPSNIIDIDFRNARRRT